MKDVQGRSTARERYGKEQYLHSNYNVNIHFDLITTMIHAEGTEGEK